MADIPLDPRLQSQLLDLYRLSGDRLASTQPVHDAAMAMATRLAPGYARAAMRPTPTPSAPLTTGDLGQTGGTSTAGKVTAAALASLLANGGPGGASGNLGKLVKDLWNWFHRNKGGGPDSGPASIPGGSSDFNDWAFNTGTFNPEDPRNASPLDSNQFPGYSNPMDDYLKTFEPGGSNFTGPMQPPDGGGSENTGTNWWDE
jgi:hypothetical protein